MLPMLNTMPPQMVQRGQYTGMPDIGGSQEFSQMHQTTGSVAMNEMSSVRLCETLPFSHHRPTIIDSVSACDARFRQLQQPSREEPAPSLEELIARKQGEILAHLGRLHPSSALDSLLLSAMLASPSSNPESRISAALRAVAALSSPPAGRTPSGPEMLPPRSMRGSGEGSWGIGK